MSGYSTKKSRLSPLKGIYRGSRQLIALMMVVSASVMMLLPSAHATNSDRS